MTVVSGQKSVVSKSRVRRLVLESRSFAGIYPETRRWLDTALIFAPTVVVILEGIEVEDDSLALLEQAIVDQPADGRRADASEGAVFEIGDLVGVSSVGSFIAEDLAGIDHFFGEIGASLGNFPEHRSAVQFFLSPNVGHENFRAF